MRIKRLHLQRFGHFEDLILDLPMDRPRFHLVYGPNEAGKSTTLRAIRGFFFGIPDQSPDSHTHGGDLRLLMELRVDGQDHSLVRRKGRKHTLRDHHDSPLPEEFLQRLLGGVSETVFTRLFGLDHEGLRAGADALLLDGGQLGESLFEAGVSGRGVRPLLTELRSEAAGLFLARGKNPALNKALEALTAIQRACQDESLSVDAFRAQEKRLLEAQAHHDELKRRRRAKLEERARLQRLVTIMPLLQRTAECERRRAAIGDVPRVPEGTTAARESAQAVLLQSEPEIAHRTRALEQARARLAALKIPETLLELDAEVIAMLRDRLGSHRKALSDLPRRREAARVAEAEARALLRRLGLPQKVVNVDAPSVVTFDRARVRRLSREFSGRKQAVAHSAQLLAERSAELSTCEQEGGPELVELDVDRLQLALRRGKAARAEESYLREQQVELSALREQIRASSKTLTPHLTQPADEVAERGPLLETVQGFASRRRDLQQRTSRWGDKTQRWQERLAQVDQQLDELQRGGPVATEDQLQALREERDLTLEGHLAQPGDEGLVARLRTQLRDCDQLSDRMRREVDRAARLSRHVSDRAGLLREQVEFEAKAIEFEKESTAERAAFEAFCGQFGLKTTLTEDEACAVVQRLTTHSGLLQRHTACQLRTEALMGERSAALAELARALPGAPPDPRQVEDSRLPERVAEAESLLLAHEGARAQHQAHTAKRESLEQDLARLQRQHASDCAALEAWQADWLDAMKALPLRSDATVDEAQAVLDDLAMLAAKLDEVRKLRDRITAMEADAESFAQDVFRLHDKHLYRLGEMPLDEAAVELVSAYEAARRDAAEREVLLRGAEEQERAIAGLSLKCETARRTLSDMCVALNVETPAALAAAEQRSVEAERLDRELKDATDQLIMAADGVELSALRAEAEGERIDAVRAALDEVMGALEALDQELEKAVGRVTEAATELSRLRDTEGSADLANEVAEQEERVRGYVHRFVRLRLAEKLLEREILRYRERHQGPLLARAGQLFAELTCGRYRRIEAAYDDADRAVLRCLRADGTLVGVEGLSDGSRDPLFLALRLAALERQPGPRLPLILDDILVHADDERAEAALSVLGRVAAERQVLFFSHHDHLRVLARRALSADCLSEHTLPAPGLARRQLDLGEAHS